MEDLACFCGGLGKFSEMLITVKGLLCEAEEFNNQDHDDSLLGAAAPSLDSDVTQNRVSLRMCSLKEYFAMPLPFLCFLIDRDDFLLGAAAPSLDSDATHKQVSMTMCSFKEMLSCTGEIRSAYTHCIGKLSIRTCINDILGASDCYKCVCDVLPFLCVLGEKSQDHDDSLLGASLESSSDSGVFDLYEGNGATQNQVCTLRWGHQV